jgi:hypothetical protein
VPGACPAAAVNYEGPKTIAGFWPGMLRAFKKGFDAIVYWGRYYVA